ncbi:MAG: AraC family transcriptional regulator ligand-binding domain-containing protein, partial [Bacteroidota bacterium]
MTEFVIARNMLLHLLRFAGQRGLDLEHLYVRLGLAEAGDMIPFASFAHVAEAVAGPEPDVTGLYMGSQLNVAALGIVGQLIQHSRTIREALTLASDRFNLISNVLKLDLEEGEEIMRLVFSVNADCMARYPETCRMLLASSMTFAWMEVEYLTLKQVQPLSVHWPIKPVDPAPFEKTFGLGGQFGAEGYTLVFPASVLELPIVYADYALLMRMEALACSRLQAVQGEAATFTDKVRRLVYGLIDPGFPSLDTLAGHLHLTTR